MTAPDARSSERKWLGNGQSFRISVVKAGLWCAMVRVSRYTEESIRLTVTRPAGIDESSEDVFITVSLTPGDVHALEGALRHLLV